MALEKVDLENFGFPYTQFESPYPNFQHEGKHGFYIY